MKTLKSSKCWKCKRYEIQLRGEPGRYYVKKIEIIANNMFSNSASGVPVTYPKEGTAREHYLKEWTTHEKTCNGNNKYDPGKKFNRGPAVSQMK